MISFIEMDSPSLPIAIIGAGPVGLAAAAHLVEKGERPLLIEAGISAGASVRSWGHVSLFSPWRYCIDQAAARLLEWNGWTSPDPEEFPTGRELYDAYLGPLSRVPEIAAGLHTQCTVTSITRHGFDKQKTIGRADAPFAITTQNAEGKSQVILARAVIDASGTYTTPNSLGCSGVPSIGEAQADSRILHRIPDATGADRGRMAGRRIAVVGAGHSAFNALLNLAEAGESKVVWAVRRGSLDGIFGGETADELPARGALGSRVRRLIEEERISVETAFRIVEVVSDDDHVSLIAEDGRWLEVDEVVCLTGYRPNLSMISELQLDLHPSVESPKPLAEMIDPNYHSCGTVAPHGAVELAQPEKDFYIVGMKSYGRAPTFLMLTGYEQVRSIACELTGDHEGARRVELVLPETGVCSGDGCCAPPATVRKSTLKVV